MPSPNETFPSRPAARASSFVLGNALGPGNPGRPRRPSPPRSPAAPLGQEGREARKAQASPTSRLLPFPRPRPWAGKAGRAGKHGKAPQAVASPFSRPHPWPKRLLQTKRPPPGPQRGPFPLFSAIPPDRETRAGPAGRRLPFPGCPLGRNAFSKRNVPKQARSVGLFLCSRQHPRAGRPGKAPFRGQIPALAP